LQLTNKGEEHDEENEEETGEMNKILNIYENENENLQKERFKFGTGS